MAEEVYKEEAKTVEELQAEIAALKQELADMKAQSQPADDAAASVVKAMEESTEDKDVKVEMLCRWAAARAARRDRRPHGQRSLSGQPHCQGL